jgi:hypothetical protein
LSPSVFKNFCLCILVVSGPLHPLRATIETHSFLVAGLSKSVVENRNSLLLSQIEAHAPNKEKYSLIAKVVHVGVALLVYILDEHFARVADVQPSWTGCGPGYLGNKGAVGVRFRFLDLDGGLGEILT